jgi:hypothetical protein
MDTNTVIWGFGFPLLLALVVLGISLAFSMTDSESTGFLIAKASFAVAAFDCVAMPIYWVLATRQPTPWNVVIPTIVAAIIVPALVLSLQWLARVEAQLSTRLYPGNEPMPALPFKADVTKDKLQVILGTNIAWPGKFPQTVLRMDGEKMIEIDKDARKNQLVVSILKIFDDRNNIIARVDAEDGFWVENSTRKKRPNPSTLVVYDHSDVEVLRMVFLNPTTLSITGIFRHPQIAKPVVVTPEYIDVIGKIRTMNSIFGPAGLSIINVDR